MPVYRQFNVIKGINNGVPEEFVDEDQIVDISNFNIDRGILKKRADWEGSITGLVNQELVVDNINTKGGLLYTMANNYSVFTDKDSYLNQINKRDTKYTGLNKNLISTFLGKKGVMYNNKYFYVQQSDTISKFGNKILNIDTQGFLNDIIFSVKFTGDTNPYIFKTDIWKGKQEVYDNFNLNGAYPYQVFNDDTAGSFGGNTYLRISSGIDTYQNNKFLQHEAISISAGVDAGDMCTVNVTHGVGSLSVDKYLIYNYSDGANAVFKAYKFISGFGLFDSGSFTHNGGQTIVPGKLFRVYRTCKNRLASNSNSGIKFHDVYSSAGSITAVLSTGSIEAGTAFQDFWVNPKVSDPDHEEFFCVNPTQRGSISVYKSDLTLSRTLTITTGNIAFIQGFTNNYESDDVYLTILEEINPADPTYLKLHIYSMRTLEILKTWVLSGSYLSGVIDARMYINNKESMFTTQEIFTQANCNCFTYNNGSPTTILGRFFIAYETDDGDITPPQFLCNSYGSGSIMLYDIPIGESNIVKRHIFTARPDMFLQTIPDNTTKYLYITTTASTTSTNFVYKHFFDIVAKDLAVYNNRLWVLGKGKDNLIVYFTDTDSEYIGVDNYIELSNSKGNDGEGTTLIANQTGLYVFTDGGIWRISGWDATNFVVEKIYDKLSVKSKDLIALYSGVIFFINQLGIYALESGEPKLISKPLQKYVNSSNWKTDLCINGKLDIYYNKLFLYGKVRDTALSGKSANQMLVYDIDYNSFTIYDFDESVFNGIIVSPYKETYHRLYCINATKIYEYNQYHTAYVSAGSFTTKIYNFGNPDTEKNIDSIYFYMKDTGGSISVSMKTEYRGSISTNIDGIQTTNTGIKGIHMLRPVQGACQNIQLIVNSNDNFECEIYGWEFVYTDVARIIAT